MKILDFVDRVATKLIKWHKSPCKLKTNNPASKALVNIFLISVKTLFVWGFIFIPFITIIGLGPIFVLAIPIELIFHINYDDAVTAVMAVIACSTLFLLVFVWAHSKYEILKRYYRIYGKK